MSFEFTQERGGHHRIADLIKPDNENVSKACPVGSSSAGAKSKQVKQRFEEQLGRSYRCQPLQGIPANPN
jgi:hypothetical protein